MIDRRPAGHELPDWFAELLVQRATEGLNPEQQRAYDFFVDNHEDPDWVLGESEQFELTVAAVDVAISSSSGNVVEMPDSLRQRVLSDADQSQTFGTARRQLTSVGMADKSGRWRSIRETAGWLTAAACLAILVFNTMIPERTLSEKLARFTGVARPADLVDLEWIAVPADLKASGRVVWSDSSQQGFMVIKQLPVNNPMVSQYQLWIFDTDKGQQFPVDGGVFDITDSGEMIIPIDAKIRVAKAVQFAVTEEKPGGVVVSDRSRLPLVAALP